MTTATITQIPTPPQETSLDDQIQATWQIIAPFWPLKNLIAVNPLQGFETLPIEEALKQSSAYFLKRSLPAKMDDVNRETIKWLQAYLDDGQATIAMPLRKQGFYQAIRQLAIYDESLHLRNKRKLNWLKSLPDNANAAIEKCVHALNLPADQSETYFKLMLTTLPGWASFIKYQTEWVDANHGHAAIVDKSDYLAIRLIITFLIGPDVESILKWHETPVDENLLEKITTAEKQYEPALLEKLTQCQKTADTTYDAQFIFCIDVRSEPYRRSLESVGNYETFGFAGFFGIAAQITDTITGKTHASCPVLLTPKHKVSESPCCPVQSLSDRKRHRLVTLFKKLYQSIKYTFTTPFALAEGLGLASGTWIGLRTLTPSLANKIKTGVKHLIRRSINVKPCLDTIPFDEKCKSAEAALRAMGMTKNFSSLVVFCGHGSTTENNAYASALDCGACGGHQGCSNARIIADILNEEAVRENLALRGLHIPLETIFIGAKHNTTTDEVTLYTDLPLTTLKNDLKRAQKHAAKIRIRKIAPKSKCIHAKKALEKRSYDWAQVRPEWGLANNAAFIIGPRSLTKSIDLDGRCFLHSYDYTQDQDASSLRTILTAPMVVAQWINAQYLFSTLDNIAYGSGSKITHNITGKIGVIQGNASDLMTGLSLQSLYQSDTIPFHKPQRLLTIVYAPTDMIDQIIASEAILQKLFGNGWVKLIAIDPQTKDSHALNRQLKWEKNS